MIHSNSETELGDITLDLKTLSPFKMRLLTQAVTNPPFFIDILEFDIMNDFISYKCEICIQKLCNIHVLYYNTRYSKLLLLYNELKGKFCGNDPGFPPKIWFHNVTNQVGKLRMEGMKPFINSINKIPNVLSNTIFKQVFPIDFESRS